MGLVLCWGSEVPGKAFFPGDTQEPPALVMIPEVGSGGGRELLALEAMVGAECLVTGR